MKAFLKGTVFWLLSLLPRAEGKPSILMYHSVGKNTEEFTISPQAFERQLRYLTSHAYTILPLRTLIERVAHGDEVRLCIALTFDDGYEDMYEVVFPLIQKMHIPISIFLSTGQVGRAFPTSSGSTLPMLTWEQIREMNSSGLVEFLPHGRMHHALPALSAAEMKEEIMGSVDDLERQLGSASRIYAYAKGKYNAETLRILSEESFLAGVTVRPGYVSASTSMLELPRNHIDKHTGFSEFVSRVRGSAEWYERLKLWV